MADAFYEIRKVLSDIFLVPSAWFKSHLFITNLVVPMVLSTVFFYYLLTRKLKIFKRSAAANWGISIVLAFFSILWIVKNPSFSVFMTVMGIMILRGDRITGRRLLFAIIVALVTVWINLWFPQFLWERVFQ
jgi:hypothetical protein